MAVITKTLSLTRPSEPQKDARSAWHFNIGLGAAITGMMLLLAFFIVDAIVAGWVSGQDPTDFGRIIIYQAWLSPVSMAAVALVMVGIAVILLGVVRRLWIQVAVMKQALLALKRGGMTS